MKELSMKLKNNKDFKLIMIERILQLQKSLMIYIKKEKEIYELSQ